MKSNNCNLADAPQLELLYRQAIGSSSGSFAAGLAGLVVFGVYGVTDFLLFWVGTVLLTSGMRIILLRQRLNVAVADEQDLRERERLHYWTGLSSAASWGLLAFMPSDHLPVHVQALTWVVPMLVATVAMSSYSVVLRHYRDFMVVLTTCVLAGIFFRHGLDSLAGTIMYVLVGPVVYFTGKRYNAFMLDARQAHKEAQEALLDLEEANKNLLAQQATIEQEEEIARHVFQQLTLASENRRPGIHAWNKAMGSLSGDLIQISHGPDNQTYIFLGDFTGHGLPAALGAVPASTVFQAMVDKGLPVEIIARELNRKLYTLLPTGYFCCAALIDLSADRKSLEIWNGGLPPVAIRRGSNGEIIQLPGQNLPLGVVDDASFLDQCSDLILQEGDTVYVYSDGLTEAENVDGQMWGLDRFLAFLERQDLDDPRLEALKEEIMAFTHKAPASDDISIIEIEASPQVQKQQQVA